MGELEEVPQQRKQVLFLCTGNSARSIMAEAALNHPAIGGARFAGFSAGSQPTGRVNPYALETLQRHGISTAGLRSKSWDEFAAAGAPKMDFVLTVCGNAAGETCPLWLGQPTTAHWGVEDPAAVTGSPEEIHAAFEKAFRMLVGRIEAMVALPLEAMDRPAVESEMRAIGAR